MTNGARASAISVRPASAKLSTLGFTSTHDPAKLPVPNNSRSNCRTCRSQVLSFCARTTTSVSWLASGESATASGFGLISVMRMGSRTAENPVYETTSSMDPNGTSGSEKCPFSSVVVPRVLPFRYTLAKGSGCPSAALVMSPVSVACGMVWARANRGRSRKSRYMYLIMKEI